MDSCRCECAVFGIFGHEQASFMASEGLFMLQHRGEQATGMAVFDESDGSLRLHKNQGLVQSIFIEPVLQSLGGRVAIGHNRYSTRGANTPTNIQPFIWKSKDHEIAGASNGDVPRYLELRESVCQKLPEELRPKSENDGELIVILVGMYLDETNDPLKAIRAAMEDLKGASFSAVFIINGELWAFRDPLGFRPLCLGRLGTSYLVASETCAFDTMGAKYLRDIFPGQIVQINKEGERSFEGATAERLALCEFEFIYYARPDSTVFGESVSKVRERFGASLYNQAPAEADIVISVPDSSNSAAIGYANASGIRFGMGLIRHHHSGRQFQAPRQELRDSIQKFKHNPDKAVIAGNRIVVVDDSIVRGTASRKIVRMLRSAGAKEVHFRVTCPPITASCYYGIDTPTRQELIASTKSIQEIRHFIEADSLAYLTLENLYKCLPGDGGRYCSACFTGKYPYQELIPEHKFR